VTSSVAVFESAAIPVKSMYKLW